MAKAPLYPTDREIVLLATSCVSAKVEINAADPLGGELRFDHPLAPAEAEKLLDRLRELNKPADQDALIEILCSVTAACQRPANLKSDQGVMDYTSRIIGVLIEYPASIAIDVLSRFPKLARAKWPDTAAAQFWPLEDGLRQLMEPRMQLRGRLERAFTHAIHASAPKTVEQAKAEEEATPEERRAFAASLKALAKKIAATPAPKFDGVRFSDHGKKNGLLSASAESHLRKVEEKRRKRDSDSVMMDS